MENIIQSLQLKQELDSLRPLSSDDELRIMDKFRLDWNYHSNNLEGNSLTYGETKALILFNITAQGKPFKDYVEIKGHDKAIKWVLSIINQERPINNGFICELHQLILVKPYEVDTITPDGKPSKKMIIVGDYKKTPNHVETKTGEMFWFATPEETPALMTDLTDWYRNQIEKKDFNPILIASEFHYKFIRIHPFDDGNGRMARILMNFILLTFGYPPVIIKTEDKERYYSVLRQADAGTITPFIEYIGENLIHSLELMIKGAKGESIDDSNDLHKEIALLEQKLREGKKPISISKSNEIILDTYNASISPLIKKFWDEGGKFEKLYIKNHFKISIDEKNYSSEILNFDTSELKSILEKNIQTINLEYSYTALNELGYQKFSHYSSIYIKFELTSFSINGSNEKTSITKMYSEVLTEKEINDIVKNETDLHQVNINEHIDRENKRSRLNQ